MPTWLNQLFEKKKKSKNGEQPSSLLNGLVTNRDTVQKNASSPSSDSAIVQKARQAAEEEATQIIAHAKEGADDIRKRVTDTLKNVIDRAVNDAEQVSTAIKTKAKAEAEEEAARIIAEARQKAVELSKQSDTPWKPADEMPSVLDISDLPGDETKQKLQLYLLKTREQIEREVREEYQQAQARLLNSISGSDNSVVTPPALSQTENMARPSSSSENKPVAEVKDAKQSKNEAKLAAKMEAKGEPKQNNQLGNLTGRLAWLFKNKKKTDEQPVVAETVKAATEAQLPMELKAAPPPAEAVSDTKSEILAQLENKPPKAEPFVSQPVKEQPQQRPAEKKAEQVEINHVLQKLDTEAIYNGEIELAISVPVDPAAVSKLYNYIQSTPDMKILYTRGSWDKGTVITVALDKPMPFIGMISRISGLQIGPSVPQKDNVIKGSSSSLLGAKRKEVTRVDLKVMSG